MLEDIIKTDFSYFDKELQEKFKDWDSRGLVGCSLIEYQILFDLAMLKNVKNILEIGFGRGASTETFLTAINRKGYGNFKSVDLQSPEEMTVVKDKSKISFFTGKSSQYFDLNKTERFDLIFVDGCHRPAPARRDIEDSLTILNEGGIIACHDLLHYGEHTDVRLELLNVCREYNRKYHLFENPKHGNGIGLIY